MSDNQQSVPFNRDKFLRALYMALRQEALEYKAKADGTSNDALVLGPKPLMYEFFTAE